MKSFGLCLACLALYPFVRWSERKQAAQDALARAVAGTIPPKRRVAAWMFPTGHGTELGWRVKASCPEEASEIISQSPCFGAHA